MRPAGARAQLWRDRARSNLKQSESESQREPRISKLTQQHCGSVGLGSGVLFLTNPNPNPNLAVSLTSAPALGLLSPIPNQRRSNLIRRDRIPRARCTLRRAAAPRPLRRLQPYVEEAATLCGGGCNPMCSRLQPYVQQAAILCSLFAGAMHTPRLNLTLTVTLKCSQPNLHPNLHPNLSSP